MERAIEDDDAMYAYVPLPEIQPYIANYSAAFPACCYSYYNYFYVLFVAFRSLRAALSESIEILDI